MSEKGKEQKINSVWMEDIVEDRDEFHNNLKNIATATMSNSSPVVDLESVMDNFSNNLDLMKERLMLFDKQKNK